MRYWEDLQPETKYQTGKVTLTESDIIEFASEFDPQPYHLDKAAAKTSIFGGLCASGWQVCALTTQMIAATMASEQFAFVGLEQISALRWRRPVFVDEEVSATIVLGGPQDTESDPGLGGCAAEVSLRKTNDEVCMLFHGVLLFKKAKSGAK